MTPVTPARSVGQSVSRSVGPSVCRSIGAVLLAVICASCALQAQGNLTVAAAASLGPALREISANFERSSGTHVELVYGASGNLAMQIENGAPFDVFLSADMDYPRSLEAKGAAAPGSLAVYATGKLVLWVTNAGVDVDRLQPQMLLLDSVHKIAIANPQHAPYGKAAVEFLRKAGLYDRVVGKFVLGDDVAQTAEFVRSGNAQVGIIPLSLALAPAMKAQGKYREIAAGLYTPIRQASVILKNAKNPFAAAKFLAYVRSAAAEAVLARYGFDPPAEEHK